MPRTVSGMNDSPRDTDGAKLCAWCGDAIRQSGVGRSRDYCRRSCRQRAYEQRKTAEITRRNVLLIRHELTKELASSNSSRDESLTPNVSSRDETRTRHDSSRDEMKPAGPAPVPAQAADHSPPPRPVPRAPTAFPSGPSRSERRRLLPPPPGAQRPEAPTLFEPEAADGE